jgi:hypothetical protein
MSSSKTRLPRIEREHPPSTIRISHNLMEGTRVSGPPGRALSAILDAHGFRWSHRLKQWCLPGSTGSRSLAERDSLADELRQIRLDVQLAPTASATPLALAGAPLPTEVITLRRANHLTFVVQRALFEALRTRLLGLGGKQLVIPETPDPELQALIGESAVIFDGYDAVWRPGARRACHRNTVELWLRHEAQIVTGYALAPDGAWVQHTWGLTEAGSLIETTLPFEKYLGVRLSGESANEFAEANS